METLGCVDTVTRVLASDEPLNYFYVILYYFFVLLKGVLNLKKEKHACATFPLLL